MRHDELYVIEFNVSEKRHLRLVKQEQITGSKMEHTRELRIRVSQRF